jgi:NTP pyrophosphatase (non-canonical NTP hydrolase)
VNKKGESMTLDEYQTQALKTADFNDPHIFIELILGLSGEAGEITEKVKKMYRDNGGNIESLDKDDIKKELGDILWYVGVTARYFGFSLDDVAQANVEKLASRQKRGTLAGSGDDR